jgi:hypothetical protein
MVRSLNVVTIVLLPFFVIEVIVALESTWATTALYLRVHHHTRVFIDICLYVVVSLTHPPTHISIYTYFTYIYIGYTQTLWCVCVCLANHFDWTQRWSTPSDWLSISYDIFGTDGCPGQAFCSLKGTTGAAIDAAASSCCVESPRARLPPPSRRAGTTRPVCSFSSLSFEAFPSYRTHIRKNTIRTNVVINAYLAFCSPLMILPVHYEVAFPVVHSIVLIFLS